MTDPTAQEPPHLGTTPDLPAPLPPSRMVQAADGVPIALYEFGGTGRPALFVHATGFCAGVWRPLVEHLGRSITATALDVRGHGRSGRPSTMNWDDVAADVLTAVDELGLDQPLGIGHSMGGAALLMAELARPGTFAGLWVYEPIVFPSDVVALARQAPADSPNPMSAAARRRRPRFDSAAVAYANFAAKPPLNELHPAALGAYIVDGFEPEPGGGVRLRCLPEVEADTFHHGVMHDTHAHLGEISVEVVVAAGRPDPGPAQLAAGIAAALGLGTLEPHPDLGHFGPLQDPPGIAAAIQRWAARPA